MNKVILSGRLTREPEIRYSAGKDNMCIARYTLAVHGRMRTDEGNRTDFIRCVAFGGNAQFAEKYLKKGVRIIVSGRVHSDSFTNKEGKNVFTTEVIVEEHEFAESKAHIFIDEYMSSPDNIDEELPFK